MKTAVVVIGAALLMGACQHSATVRESRGQGFVQLSGGYLVLKQPLQVQAGKARVFIQDGAVQSPGEWN